MDKPSKESPDAHPDIELETIVEEFTRRLRAGEKPAIADYCSRLPVYREELEELLSSAAMIEELKASGATQPTRDLSEVHQLRSIGDYDLVRELGRGGMGVVFEGVHRSLGRRVAVKIVPRSVIENQNYLERFQREAQAAANLHHSNIVSVFGVGNSEGHWYYVMEFIDGANLSHVIWQISNGRSHQADTNRKQLTDVAPTRVTQRDSPNASRQTKHMTEDETDFEIAVARKPPVVTYPESTSLRNDPSRRIRWAANLSMQVADGLAYAHEHGVLHRDIKPANLILDSDHRVWITDFGLVKNITDQSLTKTGDIVGTIQYMPPEAFKGKYDVRSETYSLGLTLYELLCLDPVFANTSTPELIRQIMSPDATAKLKLLPNIPRDLETIVRKAVAREPSQRYQTAAEFRDDLRAFLEDRPILARRPSAFEKLGKWAKRNPLVATLTTAIAFLTLSFAVVISASYQRLSNAYQNLVDEKSRTQQQFERAEANLELAIEAFGSMYRNVLLGDDARDGTLVDGFQELSGIETVVTEKDAALLESLIGFYERFAELNETNQTLETETSRALRRVANIYRMLGEVTESISVYQKALMRYKTQWENQPNSVDAIIDYVRLNNEYALALLLDGQMREFRQAFETSKRLLEEHPAHADPRLRLELARTFNFMGANATLIAATFSNNSARNQPLWRLLNRRRGPRGNNAAQRPTTPYERPAAPDDRPRRPGNGSLGNEWRKYRFNFRATEIVEELLEAKPNDRELQLELAKCYTLLAALQGPNNESHDYVQKSIDLFEKLLMDDPENTEAKYRLALSCVLPNTTQLENGEKWIARAMELIDELTMQHPTILEYQQVAVIVYAKQADQQLEQGKLTEAETSLDRAARFLSGIVAKTTSKFRLISMHRMLANLYRELGQAFEKQSMTSQARRAFRVSQQILRLIYSERERPQPNREPSRQPSRGR